MRRRDIVSAHDIVSVTAFSFYDLVVDGKEYPVSKWVHNSTYVEGEFFLGPVSFRNKACTHLDEESLLRISKVKDVVGLLKDIESGSELKLKTAATSSSSSSSSEGEEDKVNGESCIM